MLAILFRGRASIKDDLYRSNKLFVKGAPYHGNMGDPVRTREEILYVMCNRLSMLEISN